MLLLHILVVYFCKKNLFLVFQIAFSFTHLSNSRKERADVNHYEEHPCPDITKMAWYLTKNNICRWVTWILLLNILQACQILPLWNFFKNFNILNHVKYWTLFPLRSFSNVPFQHICSSILFSQRGLPFEKYSCT